MPALTRHLGRERAGVLLCVLAAASLAGTVILTKLGYSGEESVAGLLAVRFAIASPVLWLLAAWRRAIGGVSARDALLALALGGLLYSTQTGLVYLALMRLDAALVELLLFTFPALVVLGAIALRRERASRRTFAALALAMGGVALVLVGSGAGALEPLGAALAFGAAVLYATYSLATAYLGVRIHPLTLGALVCSGASLAAVAGGAATGSLELHGLSTWAYTAAIAVGANVVALTACLGGIARLGPGRASILLTLEPPFVCASAFLIFGEELLPLQLLGGLLVLSATGVLALRSGSPRADGSSRRGARRPARVRDRAPRPRVP